MKKKERKTKSQIKGTRNTYRLRDKCTGTHRNPQDTNSENIICKQKPQGKKQTKNCSYKAL